MNLAVSGNFNKVGIGEVQIIVCYAPGKIVFESVGKREAIEPAGDDHIKVFTPEVLVEVPHFVLEFAAKIAADGSHLIRRLFGHRLRQMQPGFGIRGEPHALGEFEKAVDEASLSDSRYEQRGRV